MLFAKWQTSQGYASASLITRGEFLAMVMDDASCLNWSPFEFDSWYCCS